MFVIQIVRGSQGFKCLANEVLLLPARKHPPVCVYVWINNNKTLMELDSGSEVTLMKCSDFVEKI